MSTQVDIDVIPQDPDMPPKPPEKPPLADYLRNGRGEPSTMRLMSLIALIVGCAFGVIAVFTESHNSLDLAIWLWGFAFTGKAAQSFSEARDEYYR